MAIFSAMVATITLILSFIVLSHARIILSQYGSSSESGVIHAEDIQLVIDVSFRPKRSDQMVGDQLNTIPFEQDVTPYEGNGDEKLTPWADMIAYSPTQEATEENADSADDDDTTVVNEPPTLSLLELAEERGVAKLCGFSSRGDDLSDDHDEVYVEERKEGRLVEKVWKFIDGYF